MYRDDLLRLKSDEKPDFRHEVFDEAARQVYQRGGFTPDMLAEDAARALVEETYRLMQSAMSYTITEETPPELTAALRNNAFIFSGFKTAHTLSEVGLSLTNEDGSTKPFNDFLRDVRAVDDKYNGNYLYAEYNHAVHSSQMAVKWRDFERDGDDYDLQYRTAGDERVREAHRRLDGVTLPPSDKFWERYLPPNGWNCRCNVVQVRTGKYERSDSDAVTAIGDEYTAAPKAQMFRFNAGKELKLFPSKHPYFKASRQVKAAVIKLADEEITKRRIEEMVAELPDSLTDEEKVAIATHNIKLEQAMKITKGKPMTVEEADKQNANPGYGKGREYSINCQTCAPAYALRCSGFKLTAKPNTPGSKLDYLSRGTNMYEAWKNIDGTPAQHTSIQQWLEKKGYQKMTPKRYLEFFDENCKEVGIYELSIGWKRGGGHATILQRFPDGELRYIEPQVDNSKGSGREYANVEYLAKNGSVNPHFCRGVMRIDNKLFNPDYVGIFNTEVEDG